MDAVTPRTFPWRDMLGGEAQWRPVLWLLERAGPPARRTGRAADGTWTATWTRATNPSSVAPAPGDPSDWAVCLWVGPDGAMLHAHLRLVFADGLDYTEVLW